MGYILKDQAMNAQEAVNRRYREIVATGKDPDQAMQQAVSERGGGYISLTENWQSTGDTLRNVPGNRGTPKFSKAAYTQRSAPTSDDSLYGAPEPQGRAPVQSVQVQPATEVATVEENLPSSAEPVATVEVGETIAIEEVSPGNPVDMSLGNIKSTTITSAKDARLESNGLKPGSGASYMLSGTVMRSTLSADKRVKLLAPSGSTIARLISESGVMHPLGTGVIFPYLPSIQFEYSATYNMQQPAHSNFAFPAYEQSSVNSIVIPGEFTASNVAEARYMLAAIHFFKTCTRMFYGLDDNRGSPPPVLRLRGHGQYMFDDVPVVITSFTMVLPDTVDYIPVDLTGRVEVDGTLSTSESVTMVPTSTQLTVTLQPIYSRSAVSNSFSLSEFSKGGLISNPNRGGFL
jgi:hypothetical protein